MKKHHLLLALAFTGTMWTSCNKGSNLESVVSGVNETSEEAVYTRTFAQPDDSKVLKGTPSENLKTLFEATGPKIITSLGRISITDAQYEEIKTFTTNLVKGKTSQTEQYRAIFTWIVNNVKYNNPTNNPENKYYSNDPYDVFVNKMAVCEGYSQLQVVMCHTQGIPAVVVNGLGWGVGHAWTYVCTDGVWEVSDPTNCGSFPMSNTSGYTHLSPSEADVDLFADDVAVYRYNSYEINVHKVTATESALVVPYSAGGFVIGSFNPVEDLPESVTEVYLGENIKTLGESDNMRLSTQNIGKNLCAIYVDENNPKLQGHKGVVYKKNGDELQLYYIPGGMTFIEMLPMEKVEKNTIYKHNNVKEIYFPEGTKRLEAYAIENCPKLVRVYVPQQTYVDRNAFYNCPNKIEVVRGIPSGIKNITID